jgi:DNA-directed RNA polymerase subunit E'/Rpb7
MNNIISPYKNTEQYTKIALEPYQMNSDIINNLLFNLKKKVEKKCNKSGFVEEVYRIISYSDGIMDPENLSGNVHFNITYDCKLCLPIEDSVIIGYVKIVNSEFIYATNGPLYIFIPKHNINSTYWNISPEIIYNVNNKKKLEIDTYIYIKILDKRINDQAAQIKVIGELLDFATDKDIETYFGSKIIEESNFI